jgi:hypothetical protein
MTTPEDTPQASRATAPRADVAEAIIGHPAHSTGSAAFTCQPQGTKNIPI